MMGARFLLGLDPLQESRSLLGNNKICKSRLCNRWTSNRNERRWWSYRKFKSTTQGKETQRNSFRPTDLRAVYPTDLLNYLSHVEFLEGTRSCSCLPTHHPVSSTENVLPQTLYPACIEITLHPHPLAQYSRSLTSSWNCYHQHPPQRHSPLSAFRPSNSLHRHSYSRLPSWRAHWSSPRHLTANIRKRYD